MEICLFALLLYYWGDTTVFSFCNASSVGRERNTTCDWVQFCKGIFTGAIVATRFQDQELGYFISLDHSGKIVKWDCAVGIGYPQPHDSGLSMCITFLGINPWTTAETQTLISKVTVKLFPEDPGNSGALRWSLFFLFLILCIGVTSSLK